METTLQDRIIAIPQHFKDDLELTDVILHMADDLYMGEVTKMC